MLALFKLQIQNFLSSIQFTKCVYIWTYVPSWRYNELYNKLLNKKIENMTGQQHYIKLLYKIIKCLIEMNVCEDLQYWSNSVPFIALLFINDD